MPSLPLWLVTPRQLQLDDGRRYGVDVVGVDRLLVVEKAAARSTSALR